MNYTEIYLSIFKILMQLLGVMWPLIAIAIIITVAKNKKRKTKTNDSVINIEKPKEIDYTETDYYKETHTSYEEMITDKGRAGEYAAYRELMHIEGYKKFLFDTYIPDKEDKNKKTEIDIIMIHETGIYVIECKNFKGWIYGDEASDKWCQRFKNGKKFFFYNPIKQNYRHIQLLRAHIGNDKNIISIISFGDGATLKSITNSNKKLEVINNKDIKKIIIKKIHESEKTMQQNEIDEIYNNFKTLQW